MAIIFQRSGPVHCGKLMKIALELNLGNTGGSRIGIDKKKGFG